MLLKINADPRITKKVMMKIKKQMRTRSKNVAYTQKLPPFTFETDSNDYNLFVPRTIRSHRKLVGPLLVRVRKILDDEVQRAIEPVLQKQIFLNKKIILTLQELERKLQRLETLQERRGRRLRRKSE